MPNATDILEAARSAGYKVKRSSGQWHIWRSKRRCAVVFSAEAVLVWLEREMRPQSATEVWG